MTDHGATTVSTSGLGAPRGIFDCDEAHRSALAADYERIFHSGMVALDTNVLLNLYRLNERARRDTLSVLTRLRERLWIPHQVLSEFWRNRESRSVRHYHAVKAGEACEALDGLPQTARDALDRWVSAVRLQDDPAVTERTERAMTTLVGVVDDLRVMIEAEVEKHTLDGTALTHTDPVLAELEPLLYGRIGEPLSPADHARAVQEAQQRADEEIPPGYQDFGVKPPERAAGDYLLWTQLLREAKGRGCDVLFVTGDLKEDWWVQQHGDIPARPRTELVVEMRNHAGVRLYMLSPWQLLTVAREVLGLDVAEESASDLEQLRDAGGGVLAGAGGPGGWTAETLEAFVGELWAQHEAHAQVLLAAAANGGFVGRATVHEVAGYPPDRQLGGFARPVSTVVRHLEERGVLSGDEPFLLHAVYGSAAEPSWVTGFRVPEEVVPVIRDLFEGTPLWPAIGQAEVAPAAGPDGPDGADRGEL